MRPRVELRRITDTDRDRLFEMQRDPAARGMAGFVAEDPDDRGAFDGFFDRLLTNPAVVARLIEHDGRFAGEIMKFERDGLPEVTFWIDREQWGRGIATAALLEMLEQVPSRPIYARSAADNAGSIRVLEKCGFQHARAERGFAAARGGEIDEVVMVLDSD